MPFQPAPGTAQVEVRMTQDTQQVENVFHVFLGTGWNVGLLTGLANTVRAFWEATMLPAVSSTVQLTEIVVTDISTPDGEQVTVVPSGSGFGGDASASPPNHVTYAIKWLTGHRGRSMRGRTYHVGLTNPDYTNNTLHTAYRTAMLAIYAGLKAAINGLTVHEMCVLSRYSDRILRENAICTPITSLEIDPTIDSQRRRLPGRGA